VVLGVVSAVEFGWTPLTNLAVRVEEEQHEEEPYLREVYNSAGG